MRGIIKKTRKLVWIRRIRTLTDARSGSGQVVAGVGDLQSASVLIMAGLATSSRPQSSGSITFICHGRSLARGCSMVGDRA